MASQDWFEKDFYSTLGVQPDASDAEIKKAYRKLARQWHPDQNPGDEAAEKRFKEIGEANAVLTDPEQREQYDAVRQMASGGARFTAGGPGGGGAGFDDLFGSMFGGGAGPGNVRFSTGGGPGAGAGGINLEDILAGFGPAGGRAGGFGTDSFGRYGASSGPRRGQDVEATVQLPFRSAVSGDTVSVQTPLGETVTARIPAGVKDGQRIRLRGKGYEGDPGSERGDLMLHVEIQPHPVYGRKGDDLTITVPVTFAEAALGADIPVPLLDGSTKKVRIPAGTPSGKVFRIKGAGVAAKSGAGNLLVTVSVVVPQRLTDEARAAVEALREQEADFDPRAELRNQAQS